MSAALVILPMVWATATASEEKKDVVGARKPVASVMSASAIPMEPAAFEEQTKRTAPEVAFYRKYTEGLLRRYVRMSLEAGRAPSLLGREMFRGNVTNYSVSGFDDVVIFVHDVNRCMTMLKEGQQHLVRRIAIQEFTLEETASLLGLPLRTVIRRYRRALDALTEIFLERKLLEPSKAGQEAGTIL
jgi:Sigma-70, region 4